MKAPFARGDVTRVCDRHLAPAVAHYMKAVFHGINRRPATDGMVRRVVAAAPYLHLDPILQHARSLRPDRHPAPHVHLYHVGSSSSLKPDCQAMGRRSETLCERHHSLGSNLYREVIIMIDCYGGGKYLVARNIDARDRR